MSTRCAIRLVNRLARLSPFLSREFLIEHKIKGICEEKYPQKPPFMFYRCFIGNYHETVRHNTGKKQLRPLAKRLDHKHFDGACVGDAHPENFGVVFNNRKKGTTRFTMNDADDGGQGRLYSDVLRFFAAVRLNDGSDALGPVIAAYHQGVAGKKRKACSFVQDLMDDAVKKEKKTTSKDYRKKYRDNERSKAKDNHHYNRKRTQLTGDEKDEVRTILKKRFGGQAKLVKAFTYVKVVGGSGGLRRIRMLVEFKKGKQPRRPTRARQVMLELKELTAPAMALGKTMTPKQVEKAVRCNLSFEENRRLGKFFGLIRFNGQPYELRPRWLEYRGIDLDMVKKKDKTRAAILANEAYILGQIHRWGAEHKKRYAQAVKKVGKGDWKRAADWVRDRMTGDYEDLKRWSKNN